ncbi:MAG: replication-associated recombination protein A [Actinomycetota bacterium]
MRPRSSEEVVGQQHVLEPGSILRDMIDGGTLRSILLYGPAGTGKTSIARLVSSRADAEFIQLSAVSSGVAEVRKALDKGQERMKRGGQTVLFVDEVHRFSKTQQDALLPGVEAGWVVFIGATTENPFFSVISPLLSRCVLFRLEPLTRDDVGTLVERALRDSRGLGGKFEMSEDVRSALLDRCEGDARIALGALEAAADRAVARNSKTIEREDVEDAMRQRSLRYDRVGDQHYDVVSAFIKSMRGSDPDAALAWLARMIESGEDPRFIARRMMILASEDIGMADPTSLQIAVAAAQASEMVGFPEAQIILAQAVIHLCLAPKSNAVVRAIGAASKSLRTKGFGAVPPHLRDASYRGAKALGHGVGYKYPHDFPDVEQSYMPVGFEGETYYEGD